MITQIRCYMQTLYILAFNINSRWKYGGNWTLILFIENLSLCEYTCKFASDSWALHKFHGVFWTYHHPYGFNPMSHTQVNTKCYFYNICVKKCIFGCIMWRTSFSSHCYFFKICIYLNHLVLIINNFLHKIWINYTYSNFSFNT
jgi:hypothetical protein